MAAAAQTLTAGLVVLLALSAANPVPLQGYGINFDVGLATFLRLLEPATVLEFGCGLGLYVDYLARFTNASPVYGIEPEEMLFEGSVFASVNDPVARPAQLAINVLQPVLEHIPLEFHPMVTKWLAPRVGRVLVFGAARPNQEGVGHIALRTRDDWVATWEAAGLVHMPALSDMPSWNHSMRHGFKLKRVTMALRCGHNWWLWSNASAVNAMLKHSPIRAQSKPVLRCTETEMGWTFFVS
ncbi:uncharacterized protein MONBRDRAFT_24077 [Monosiga brevicollis MX1]|uniref:Methyltransferase type 11 domain-containing protein n=1 Tax=Monosiga brevicollis TaxID=81824 RepID=A9UUM6_MONBE|nr:uncharacterized protein MONBRDRAFT_24077 [Monosiga brevicollis MX1]EDQ90927.1 predicted protein [Monosiga brevicollis MX1]|eukprot:XP_001744224.1 hypothetical protein [Monosiga brevicollis MX1]